MQQEDKGQHDKLLTREEAALSLTQAGFPTAKSTLAKLASLGGGPKFRKFGPRTLYDFPDLIAWAHSRLSEPLSSTSEAGNK